MNGEEGKAGLIIPDRSLLCHVIWNCFGAHVVELLMWHWARLSVEGRTLFACGWPVASFRGRFIH